MSGRSTSAVAVALLLATAVACGSSSGGGSFAPPSSTSPESSLATTAAPSTTASADNLPSTALLKTALLTAHEVGPTFSEDTSSDSGNSGKATGCPALAGFINAPDTPTPGQRQVQVNLAAGQNSANPIFLDEGLIAEDGAKFATDYAQFRNALATCKSLTLPVDPTTNLTLSLTPINFAPSSTGARLDGTLDGTAFNGYLVISSPHENVALLFFLFQAGTGSSQFASALYGQAEAKASAALK